MRKILFISFFSLMFSSIGFAESYYFKGCQLSENAYGDYFIDFEKNEIKVNLKAIDGTTQELIDKIELIAKDKIVSERIQNKTKKLYFLQYQLDANSNSIIRQHYKKEAGIDLVRPFGPKKESFCKNVKADWNKDKIEIAEKSKEQEEILEAQKKLLEKQTTALECQGSDYKKWTNCKGSYVTEIGHKYTGQFKDGKILEGTAIYSGGAKYVGQFKNDIPHGQGTFAYSDGSKYYGEWKDGKSHGNGTKNWKDGRKYSGQFKNDLPHGKGTFTYPDNSKYVGEYKEGKRHGEGTLTYADGQTYVGQFVSGLEYGEGLCMDQEGLSTECKVLKKENTRDSAGKNRREISLVAKKWVKLNEYESSSGKGKKVMEKLENDFTKRASELCASYGNFNILQKNIQILDLDETPAFGLEPKVQIGINGVVECK